VLILFFGEKQMKTNTAVSIGSVALIEKVNGEFNFFNRIFECISGKARNLISSTKLFIYNRLDECFSLNQIISGYSPELFELLKFKTIPGDRTLYRDLSRLGKNHQFILEKYQKFIGEEKLVTDKQFIDFSSSYFEGKTAAFGALGYSRDHEPGKKQLTFWVSTGINSIPTALTIQNGNVQDKEHFRFMLKTSEAVLPKRSLLIFDTGGNTKENKRQVREKQFHYLTLKAKKVNVYKKAIEYFNNSTKVNVIINDVSYSCVTHKTDDETDYIFFSEKSKCEQLAIKERKFKKELEKNKTILKKTKEGKEINEFLTEDGIVTTKGILQTTLDEVKNPYLNGLEGFFILESDLVIEPERVLALYKDKDKAEKFFRSVKEGMELRPMRHWSKDAIVGYIVIIFLTNFLINLTLLRAKDSVIKNTKLLKKYLRKLTLVIIYPTTLVRWKKVEMSKWGCAKNSISYARMAKLSY
jgi:transposase